MSPFNIMSAALLVLALAAGVVLLSGLQAASAGIFQTPAGGWGIVAPAPDPHPEPAPRPGRRPG